MPPASSLRLASAFGRSFRRTVPRPLAVFLWSVPPHWLQIQSSRRVDQTSFLSWVRAIQWHVSAQDAGAIFSAEKKVEFRQERFVHVCYIGVIGGRFLASSASRQTDISRHCQRQIGSLNEFQSHPVQQPQGQPVLRETKSWANFVAAAASRMSRGCVSRTSLGSFHRSLAK